MTRRGMGLSCKELVELVTDYLEDALSPDDRLRFDDHLAICEGCRSYIEQLRTTVRVLGSLSEQDISGDVRDRLLDAFTTWRRGSA